MYYVEIKASGGTMDEDEHYRFPSSSRSGAASTFWNYVDRLDDVIVSVNTESDELFATGSHEDYTDRITIHMYWED